MNKRNKSLRLNKNQIIDALRNGKRLDMMMDDNYKTNIYLDNNRLHTTSVKAACKDLNNGEDLGSCFLIGKRSYNTMILYTSDYGLLRTTQYLERKA